MAIEDRLVIVALVISLIALTVALSQASQQFLSPADGYRRCSPAVMGSWTALRYRRWLWSQFCFETIYSAPHITMINDDSINDAHQRLSLIDSEHGSHGQSVLSKRHRHILQDSIHRGRTDEVHAASWLVLLRQLHDLYISYWPRHCSTCLHIPQGASAGLLMHKHQHRPATRITPHSLPVVAFRTWTWDLMPPDLTRPPATSTLSDIILVGLRFGMNWRTVEPAKGLLAADGDGFSLLAADSQGLGLVVRFTAAGGMHKFSGNIPTPAADKMFFGIVPGDPVFVKQDYSIVPDKPLADGRLIDQGSPGNMLISVGLPNSTCHQIWHLSGLGVFHNKMVALLCPFLPIMGCPAIHLTSPIFTGARGSTFQYWEGRFGLLRLLESSRASGADSPAKKTVHEYLRGLEQKFTDDFYARDGRTMKEAGGDERTAIVEYCGKAHTATTNYFRSHGYDKSISTNKHGKPRTRYMQLVAAHTAMSFGAISDVVQRLKDDRDQHGRRTDPQQEIKYDLTPGSYSYFVEELYLYAVEYAKCIRQYDAGVVKFLRDEGVSTPADAIEDAWWMLMLRGVSWAMSILDGGGAEPPVPSSLYYNKTPVWIL